MKTKLFAAILFILLFLIMIPIWAEQTGYSSLFLNQNNLYLNANLENFFDNKTLKKLDNGLSNLFIIRITIHKNNKTTPIQMLARECIIRYELWELKYLVKITENNKETRYIRDKRNDAVMDCLHITNYKLMDLTNEKSGDYYARIITELNPVSEELISNIKRWLRRSPESHRNFGSDESFFGSMVSIFVNENIGKADKRIVLKTKNYHWQHQ